MIWNQIKALCSIVLLACVFLPISQCSQEAKPELGGIASQSRVTTFVPFDKAIQIIHSNKKLNPNAKLPLNAFAPVILFVAPFLLCLLSVLREDVDRKIALKYQQALDKPSLTLFLFELLVVVSLLAYLFMHNELGLLLFGAYIAVVVSILHIAANILYFKYTRKRR